MLPGNKPPRPDNRPAAASTNLPTFETTAPSPEPPGSHAPVALSPPPPISGPRSAAAFHLALRCSAPRPRPHSTPSARKPNPKKGPPVAATVSPSPKRFSPGPTASPPKPRAPPASGHWPPARESLPRPPKPTLGPTSPAKPRWLDRKIPPWRGVARGSSGFPKEV